MEMWLDIRSARCSVDNPSPALDRSPSTFVTFVSLSFGTDANSCKKLNYFQLSLSEGEVQNLNIETAKQDIQLQVLQCSACRCITNLYQVLSKPRQTRRTQTRCSTEQVSIATEVANTEENNADHFFRPAYLLSTTHSKDVRFP